MWKGTHLIYCSHSNRLKESQRVHQKEDKQRGGGEGKTNWRLASNFHSVIAMVGAAVLGLPYSMAALRWYISNPNYTWHEIFSKIE